MTLPRNRFHFVPGRIAQAAALMALSLAGCAVGPTYNAPVAPGDKTLTAQPLPAETASAPVKGGEAQRFVENGTLPSQWWTLFGSPVLNGWVDQAFSQSPTLDLALATLRQNEAQYQAQTGDLYPSLSANAGASRNKSLVTGTSNTAIYNLFDAGVSVRYALDIWGGVASGIRASAAALDAERQNTRAAYLTLAGNVVTASVSLASAEARLKTARQIVETYDDTVKLVQKRFDLGASSRSDVVAIQALAAQAAANVPPLETQAVQARNRLATLIGKAPSAFDITPFDLDALTLPTEIPLTLPSTLVQQRPDIAAAEANLRLASANVGVAVASQFPSLVLSAQYGSQSSTFKNLFDQNIWGVAGNLTAPIFDGGRLSAQKRAAVAAYDAAQARYRSTVLEAFRQVADSLAAIEIDARALAAQQAAYTAAQQNSQLVEKRFKAGSANIIEVRDARLSEGQAQILFVQALASRYADTAALFQALGGNGWPEAMAAAERQNPAAYGLRADDGTQH